MSANWVQIIGLVFDIIGAVLMAIDLIKLDDTVGTWAHLSNAKERAKTSRRLAIYGLFFLVIGFILQLTSTIISMLNH